jgi:hypothetical protein
MYGNSTCRALVLHMENVLGIFRPCILCADIYTREGEHTHACSCSKNSMLTSSYTHTYNTKTQYAPTYAGEKEGKEDGGEEDKDEDAGSAKKGKRGAPAKKASAPKRAAGTLMYSVYMCVCV